MQLRVEFCRPRSCSSCNLKGKFLSLDLDIHVVGLVMSRKSSLFYSSERFVALEEVLKWLEEVLKWLEEVLKWL